MATALSATKGPALACSSAAILRNLLMTSVVRLRGSVGARGALGTVLRGCGPSRQVWIRPFCGGSDSGGICHLEQLPETDYSESQAEFQHQRWSSSLRARVRTTDHQLLHDSLLKQLRVAVRDGQLDPVEWRRLREALADAAASLRPKELVLALEALASLRSVESTYLNSVLRPLDHLSGYMSGSELVTSLEALASMCPHSSSSSIALSETQSYTSRGKTGALVEAALCQVQSLTCDEKLRLLEAVQGLGLERDFILVVHVVSDSLPSAMHLETADLQRLLVILRGAAKVQLSSRALEPHAMLSLARGIQAALYGVRAALRLRLGELSCFHLLIIFTHLEFAERAISDLQEVATSSDVATFNDLSSLGSLLCKLNAVRLCPLPGSFEASAFRFVLLGALASAPGDYEAALWALSPSQCGSLTKALALTTVNAKHEEEVCVQTRALVAKLAPPLAEQLLECVELLQTDELLEALDALIYDIGYSDDYLSDRFADVLRPRLVPIRAGGEPIQKLERALRVLAWCRRPVAFAGLVGAALEDLDCRLQDTVVDISNPVAGAIEAPLFDEVIADKVDECAAWGALCRSVGAGAQLRAGASSWLEGLVLHFRCTDGREAPWNEVVCDDVASWVLEPATLAASEARWRRLSLWCAECSTGFAKCAKVAIRK